MCVSLSHKGFAWFGFLSFIRLSFGWGFGFFFFFGFIMLRFVSAIKEDSTKNWEIEDVT